MRANSVRFDLSDWLIHFFRPIDVDNANAPLVPEHMGFGNINEDSKSSALFMLRCAIRQCRLWATWSYRSGVRTIYGPHSAVCFTEMPIAAFLEAGEQRERRGEAMSQYALIFPKRALFNYGANPVIYGLDDRAARLPSGKDGSARIMPDSLLPQREQYRYVTFNPGFVNPVDWTHEREWRWPYRGSMEVVDHQVETYGVISDAEDMPGLDIAADGLSGLGVVVKTREEARWITHDILSLVDRGVIGRSHYSFILCTEDLTKYSDLRDPRETSKVIRQQMVDLGPNFSQDSGELEMLAERFSGMAAEVEDLHPDIEHGEVGGCWLWILDNTHKLTRALLCSDRIAVSKDRRYLVFPYEFSDMRSLRQREKMTKELAERIRTEFGLECGYFSVLNSEDPDELPFYCSHHEDNNMFYNNSWV